jgi:hypothetical protein
MKNETARIRMISAFLLMAGILVLAPMAGAQNPDLKPNLQPFPAGDLGLLQNGTGGIKLVFSTTTWNNGKGPLELVAEAGDPSTGRQKVYQRIYTQNNSYYDTLAGTFEWHEAHNHFHFEDYALYSLVPFNAPGGTQRNGTKTTFCLLDNVKVDTRLQGAPKKSVYSTCGQYLQGMSVGWGDIYTNGLEGQSIDVTGNPAGLYKLTIEVDPLNRIIETDETDNVACELIQISGMSVSVLGGCDSGGGGISVSSITPNSAQAGSVISVTITGSGFSPGVAVSFENGSGQTPVVSNVVVVDANTITATVNVKNGGPGRDRVWDVRVGSAKLADAFTVFP